VAEPYCGRARLSIQSTNPLGGTKLVLHDFAYESSPNTAIMTGVPEPVTMGLPPPGILMMVNRRPSMIAT
jgi:hypothetical protein